MASIEQKREALKKLFPNAKWSRKVNQMSESQVVAIYLRFQSQNAFKKAA